MTEMDRRQFLVAAGGLAAVSLFPSELPAAPILIEPLKLGLVGGGRQGRAILAELAKIEGIKVAAVCDNDATRLSGVKSRAGDAEGFEDHRAMLDKVKDLSGVIIATPTHAHKAIALDAVSAGRHVYCEAPLAHTIEDAKAIATAAAGAKTVFAVGHEGRSNPVYQLARSFFRTDAFKDMVMMRAQCNQKTTWRVGSPDPAREKVLNWRLDRELSTGLMGEIGSHQLDVVHWYRNRHPVSVRATGGIRLHTDGREIADTVLAEFAFEDGARFIYSTTLASSYEGKYEVFEGSNSSIRLAWSHAWMFKEADAPTQGWEVYANKQQIYNEAGITLIAGATQLAEQGKLKEGVGLPNSSLYYALADFVKCITEKKPAVCSAADGYRTAVVAILANQAVAKGGEIKIDESMLKVG
ncbi:MAG: Gfo/Idh/MocA family oxidoreductase [Phycisphaerales bacterium]|nr:Gfo/Idh/MocA family oxidoreductase [Phycisphaerales bacterium]